MFESFKVGGAIDAPDPRDYIAEHMLGSPEDNPPDEFDLLNIQAKNQGKTMRCTAFALTHVFEIMNTFEHGKFIDLDAIEQWTNQLAYPGTASEEKGDLLQSAPKALSKFGLTDKGEQDTDDRTFRIVGYANIDKTKESFKKWVSSYYPLFTGCISGNWLNAKKTGWLDIDGKGGGHAVAVVGYNLDGVRLLTSWGPEWGYYKNGTVMIPWDQASKLFSTYIIHDKKDYKLLFKDLTSKSWAYDAVKWALDNGVARGYGESEKAEEREFRPNQPVTRAEMCQMLYNMNKSE